MKNKATVRNIILLTVGIVILANLLSRKFFVRLDLTEDSQYTLSQASKDILKGLDESVNITAYFSEGHSPQFSKNRQNFMDLLEEFRNYAGGDFEFEFVDPNVNEEEQKAVAQKGIQPFMVQVREKNEMKQQAAFMGAIIQVGEKSETLPFIQPGTSMEYVLSSNIKKLSVEDKAKIGLIQGHGEPDPQSVGQVYQELSILYNVEPVNLSSIGEKILEYKTIVWIDPRDTIPMNEFSVLEGFLSGGGNFMLAYSPVNMALNQAQGTPRFTGIIPWLSTKGIRMDPDFITDANCGSVSVRQQTGFFSFNNAVPFPFFPKLDAFKDHPVTRGLESITLQGASPIYFTGDTAISFTSIATSSPKSGLEKGPVQFDIQKQWTEQDFTMGEQTIAAVFEGKLSQQGINKMVLISNGNFATNGPGQQGRQLPENHVSLMVNSIDWLSDDTGLIDLRTKGVTTRPIKTLEEATQSIIKWGNFLFPLILVVGIGVVRNIKRKRQREQRKNESYA